jgi:hypothetical protein
VDRVKARIAVAVEEKDTTLLREMFQEELLKTCHKFRSTQKYDSAM